jgi:hypothetical protein
MNKLSVTSSVFFVIMHCLRVRNLNITQFLTLGQVCVEISDGTISGGCDSL